MRIAVVAGEASGDLLGAALIRALRQRWDGLEFYGIAGPKMAAEGARSLYPMEKLSVRGYVEVLKSLREILAIRRGIARNSATIRRISSSASTRRTSTSGWRRSSRLPASPRSTMSAPRYGPGGRSGSPPSGAPWT
jgi:hypothetical protein